MLSGRFEAYARPALLRQGQVDPARCEEGQMATAIQRKLILVLAFELVEHLFISAVDPSAPLAFTLEKKTIIDLRHTGGGMIFFLT